MHNMTEVSMPTRVDQIDPQTLLGGAAQRVVVTQTQQRSSSQSDRAERSGRGDRHRIQRSSSSTSSSSSSFGDKGTLQMDAQTYSAGSIQAGSATGGSNLVNATALATSAGSVGSVISGERRQGRFRRQVIRLPDQAQGQVRQVRRRLPTPEPDTLERVYIQRTAGEVVEEITEIPTTPPPRVQERTVVEPAGPPQIIKRVVRVPPRSGGYGVYQQQQQQQQQQVGFQGSNVAFSTGSFGTTQQYSAGTGAVATGATGYSGGYSTGGAVSGGYQQQQGYGFGSNTGGYSSQSVAPAPGCHPAFCFYV